MRGQSDLDVEEFGVIGDRMLTGKQIENLINCPKKVVEAHPKNGMLEDKKSSFIKRRNLSLEAIDDDYEFDVFIRQNTTFIEQFSIGLLYKTNDKIMGKLLLMRYNGEHGQSDWTKDGHYRAFHIHRITESLIKEGIFEPKNIEITKEFQSFDEAINKFIRAINIKNYKPYFPHTEKQLSLFGQNR